MTAKNGKEYFSVDLIDCEQTKISAFFFTKVTCDKFHAFLQSGLVRSFFLSFIF
jgi:hypothetical protein